MPKTLVVGAGVVGQAVASWLNNQQHEVVFIDDQENTFIKGSRRVNHVEKGIELAVVSPGVPPQHRVIKECAENNVPVISEIELAAKHINVPVIGITGTNGKSTTVYTLAKLFQQEGIDAACYGNCGVPLIEYLNRGSKEELIVCELSSFALNRTKTRFLDTAVLLNITEDHLDWHGSYNEYFNDKKKIGDLTHGDFFVHESLSIDKTHLKFSSYEDLYLRVGKKFGHTFINSEKVQLPHRCEEIIQNRYPYTIINDSKSTNFACVVHACEKIEEKKVLICGGNHKGSLNREKIKKIAVNSVKHIIVFGPLSHLWRELSEFFDHVSYEETLQLAVSTAFKLLQENEVLLFSPGGNSFDLFSSFEDRGETFKRIITEGR